MLPGEPFTLVLATFDAADAILDGYAFLDNFAWNVSPLDSPTTAEL